MIFDGVHCIRVVRALLRPGRLIRTLLTIALLFILYWVVRQYRFEQFLDTLSITFDDFPNEYSAALIASRLEHKRLEYDDTSFPSSHQASNIPPILHYIWFVDLYETHPDITNIPSLGSKSP